ncbi:MAG: sigma-70 family RNA polymerase sigma factor [Candidatus Latescibacteria bacterium]|nr:sigma-70 family RNA polymerase sigma factor [Candidatus Latescibacterota bacterium]
MFAEVERELLHKCRAGDWKAYEPIVRAYEGRLYGVALSLVRNTEDARDLVQDTFVRAFKSMDLYDPERPFLGWVLSVCRNICIDFLRRRRFGRSLEGDQDEKPLQISDPGAQTDRSLLDKETRSLIWKALGQLSDEHREVLVLKDMQDLEYGEIAEILNIPQGTVASRAYYARQALRETLESMGVEYP